MQLPARPADIRKVVPLDWLVLREHILDRRRAIRDARDQIGDDRCWLDYYPIWGMVEGLPSRPIHWLAMRQGMSNCRLFYATCNTGEAPVHPPGAAHDTLMWNIDLLDRSPEEMLDHLICIQARIGFHYRKAMSLANDRFLFSLLPEQLEADFRLPPEADFLGEAKAPSAGCPSFWRSHRTCNFQTCDLHQWGPCS